MLLELIFILVKSDIMPWEQVIVTKIDGDNWLNRIKTFVIPGKEKGVVEARGSIAQFLQEGTVTCVITLTQLSNKDLTAFQEGTFPIFDLGFHPETNLDNKGQSTLDLQYSLKTDKNIDNHLAFLKEKRKLPRFFLSSLILRLIVNRTHPDCLQGSAELPEEVMKMSGINQYQSVSVYNASRGGIADTYAVPMPPGIVMTTGAMSVFAKQGDLVNICAYCRAEGSYLPRIVDTDGSGIREIITIE